MLNGFSHPILPCKVSYINNIPSSCVIFILLSFRCADKYFHICLYSYMLTTESVVSLNMGNTLQICMSSLPRLTLQLPGLIHDAVKTQYGTPVPSLHLCLTHKNTQKETNHKLCDSYTTPHSPIGSEPRCISHQVQARSSP